MAHPNVLMIVLDTARADAFEPYGGPAGATPVVADLAGRGVAFPQAISPSNWTMPAHASMFTGLLPRQFGIRAADLRDRNFRDSIAQLLERHRDRLLPEALRRAGYVTRAVSANPWIGPLTSLDRWFDEFADVRRKRPDPRGVRGHLTWLPAARDDGAAAALEHLTRWFAEPRDGKPAFWFANVMECHSPYFPPKPWNDLGPLGRWRAIDDVIDFQDIVGIMSVAVGGKDVPDRRLRRMRHLYGRAIAMLDDWLGRVLEALDRAEALDDTVVVVVADHGENFSENHLIGHDASLDQRLLRVPLIVAGGNMLQPPKLLSTTALPALIAEAAGLDAHPWTAPRDEGIVFAQDDGYFVTLTDAMRERAAKAGVSPAAIERITAKMEAATDGRFKLVHYLSGEHLYDLRADPLETRDVKDAHPADAARLRDALAAANARTADEAAAATPAGEARDLTAEQEAEIEEHLEQLGYL